MQKNGFGAGHLKDGKSTKSVFAKAAESAASTRRVAKHSAEKTRDKYNFIEQKVKHIQVIAETSNSKNTLHKSQKCGTEF